MLIIEFVWGHKLNILNFEVIHLEQILESYFLRSKATKRTAGVIKSPNTFLMQEGAFVTPLRSSATPIPSFSRKTPATSRCPLRNLKIQNLVCIISLNKRVLGKPWSPGATAVNLGPYLKEPTWSPCRWGVGMMVKAAMGSRFSHLGHGGRASCHIIKHIEFASHTIL